MTKSSALMSQEERLLWLAAAGCPEGYALIHHTELETVKENLRTARRDVDAFKLICAQTGNALGIYFKEWNRNLWEAAHHAVFDANKRETAVVLGYDALSKAADELKHIAAMLAQKPTPDSGLILLVGSTRLLCENALRSVRLQRDKRPDRRTPAQIAASMVTEGIKTLPKDESGG